MRVLLFFAVAALSGAAQIQEVQAVYLLPMSNGLDQHLAHRLTKAGVFRVVADPRKADAVFTDRLGESFEAALEKLQPPPAPAAKSKDKEEEKPAAETPQPVRFSSFGRAKGTVFLVHIKSRDVLWSVFEQPRDNTAKNLERAAERIIVKLQERLKGK
jgi:hypothetical protein